jgi:hypothetical protein
MDVWSVPPTDIRVLFGAKRRDLLALLDQLTADEWAAASPAHGWTVKDVAAHLLDGDLGGCRGIAIANTEDVTLYWEVGAAPGGFGTVRATGPDRGPEEPPTGLLGTAALPFRGS